MAAIFFSTAFLHAAAAQGMRDQQGLPNSPQGVLAEKVIAALSAGDGEQFSALMHEKGSDDFVQSRDAQADRTFARQFGFRTQGLEIWGRRLFGEEGNELNVLAKEKLSGRWRQVTFVFSGEQIETFGVAYAMPPTHAQPGPLSKKQAQKQIAAYLEAAEAAGLFSGAVLVAHRDEILLNAPYGYASSRYMAPNTLTTRFNLASVNKMFTASLILRMVERGELSLDTTVSEILDESWISNDIGAVITIQHLLTHMSGLGSYFTEEFLETSPLLYRNVDDYKELITQQTLAFEPGTAWRYSNAGYVLLGAIIEKLGGAPYDAQLASELLSRVEMNSTGCFAKDEPVRNVATNLYIDFSEDTPIWREETLWGTARGGPAGGCYSTTQDLWRFANALLNDSIFTQATRDMAWTDYTPDSAREDYGLGFFIWSGPFGRHVGHSGGFLGPNAELRIDPETGWITVILSNSSEGVREALSVIEWILSRVDG